MIRYRKPGSSAVIMAPVGFSWTTLFFGWFPALWRGDIKGASLMALSGFVTFGAAFLFWPFIYNRFYMEELESRGWRRELSLDGEDESYLPIHERSYAKAPVYHDSVAAGSSVDPDNLRYPAAATILGLDNERAATSAHAEAPRSSFPVAAQQNLLGHSGGFGRRRAA